MSYEHGIIVVPLEIDSEHASLSAVKGYRVLAKAANREAANVETVLGRGLSWHQGSLLTQQF